MADDVDFGMERLDVETRELFEKVISAVGTPASLGMHARRYLLALYDAGGVEAVKQVLANAERNRSTAERWLESRRSRRDA